MSVPKRTRTSRLTGAPTAANIRRIWRFSPGATSRDTRRPAASRGRRSCAQAPHLGRASPGAVRDQRARRPPPARRRAPGPRAAVAQRRRSTADRVLALDAVARVKHPLRPRAIVREQQQPFRVAVQPADRIEPAAPLAQRRRDEVEHRRAGVPIADRARHAGRLGEDEVDAPLDGRSICAAVDR